MAQIIKKQSELVEFVNSQKWHKNGNWKSTILVNELATVALTKNYFKPYGIPFDFSKIIDLNDVYMMLESEFEQTVVFYLGKIKTDLKYLDKVAKVTDKLSVDTLNKLKSVDNFSDFFDLMKPVMALGVGIVPLDTAIAQYLKENNYSEDLLQHIYPIRKAEMVKSRSDLLRIKLFLGDKPTNAILKKADLRLSKHRELFGWMNTINWRLEQFTVDDYKKELNKITVDQAKSELDVLSHSKSDLVKNYLRGKDKQYGVMLSVLRKLLDAKMLNWDVVGIANTTLRKLHKNSALLSKMPYSELVRLTSSELLNVESGILSLEQARKLTSERKNGKFMVYDEGVTSIIAFDEKTAQNLIPLKVDETQTHVKGQCAYAGDLVGTVRVIESPAHSNEMLPGEILICPMTNPDYMPAIVKASAIITDEGGMLCHAAIISRELKKPCIIGTRHATKIFKTGERVQILAKQGICQKLFQ